MRRVNILNKTRPLSADLVVEEHATFGERFKGLMLRKDLTEREGILIVGSYQSRVTTAIHSLFMCFDFAAIWLDCAYQVVDVRIIPRWRVACLPALPACYVLEIHPSRVSEFNPGDKVLTSYA